MTSPLVVVLARNADLRAALHRLLQREGFAVRTSPSGLPPFAPGEDVAGVLVDAGLPEAGPDLPTLQATCPSARVLVMAGRSDHPVLVAAVREGALPLTADFDVQQLLDTLWGGDGPARVREPRRPLPTAGTDRLALPLPVD